MGNCCRSPAAVAREDVKSSNYSENDHNRKEKAGADGAAGKKLITVLTEVSKESIEEKYMVDQELGWGEFGVTYLCIDRTSRELLACKSISKRKLWTAVDVEDVRREVAIMKHLPENSNIVTLREACKDDNGVTYVGYGETKLRHFSGSGVRSPANEGAWLEAIEEYMGRGIKRNWVWGGRTNRLLQCRGKVFVP